MIHHKKILKREKKETSVRHFSGSSILSGDSTGSE